MANSIIQNEKECFITKATNNLHKHHIFMGPNRNLSEQYGFWVWLSAELHNQSDDGVHCKNGHALDLMLKQTAQKAYQDLGHTTEQFRAIIGKSYL